MAVSMITAVDEAFSVLVCRPEPLVFDARGLPDAGLPQPVVALDELRELMVVRRVVSGPVVDTVWRRLVVAARSEGPEWSVGAVGMAVPGLRAIAARLGAGRPRSAEDLEDIDAAVVTGFVAAVRTEDLDRPRLWWRLMWVAWRSGHRAAQVRETSQLPADLPNGSSTPRAPYGHPDLLLGRAVASGVVSAEEAELIGETRLGGVLIEALAGRGVSAGALRMRRLRAEQRLVEAVQRGDLSGPVLGAEAARDPFVQARRDGLPVRPVRRPRHRAEAPRGADSPRGAESSGSAV